MVERLHVSSGGPWEALVGYSRAVRVGEHVWVSGCTGTRPDGSVVEGIAEQARLALQVAANALEQTGARLSDVVMVRCYLVEFAEFEEIFPVLRECFGDSRPAMTAVQVAALIDPHQRIEIELQAVAGSSAFGG